MTNIPSRTPSPAVAVRIGDGCIVARRCDVADRPWSRLQGLIGRASIDRDEGLLIEPCSSVHMIAMRFAIDVAFVDCDGRVLRVVENLKPWRIAACNGSRKVLELAAGRTRQVGLAVGDKLCFTTALAGQPDVREALLQT